MARKGFIRELQRLTDNMIEMTEMTATAMHHAMDALERNDHTLAKLIIEGDDAINDKQLALEQHCMEILAVQQPVASDVRLVISILKMTTDIERIADHAADISEIILQFDSNKPYVWNLALLRQMDELTHEMLQNSLRAHLEHDLELAKEVCNTDKQVNALFSDSVEQLRELIRQDQNNVQQCTLFMFIAKYYERVGDHITNLAEWIIYNITGIFMKEGYFPV